MFLMSLVLLVSKHECGLLPVSREYLYWAIKEVG